MDSRMSLSDTVFEFLEEGEGGGSDRSSDGSYRHGFDDGDGDDEVESGGGAATENKVFWETQHQVLQETLSRTTSTEIKIRQRTDNIVRKMRSAGSVCRCSSQVSKECRSCALNHIAEKLREAGYDSALCKSKWRRSPDIPSGEHSYVDVVTEAKNGKKGAMRVVIELNFRAEFEMARSSREFNSLVSCLPEVFVGKAERLKAVVKIVCGAAKKCMKDNKMHMGPWRKHKYMQSKWLETPERTVPPPWSFAAPAPAATERQQPKLRASMLTFDLHCSTAVEVV